MPQPVAGSSHEYAIALCGDLIRLDSSAAGSHERGAAERVAAELDSMGLSSTILESEPGRTSVVSRLEGSDPTQPALLVQMHLDVVPADPTGWTVPPFAGEILDDHLWGRGAVDMKNMVAMCLAAVRSKLADGWRPQRSIVFAFVPDEEQGGDRGAGWLVDTHRDLFEGCTESIGEAGGFTQELAGGGRAFLVQVAEKGVVWLRLSSQGPGGHGSLLHDHNPAAAVAGAVQRLAAAVPELRMTDTTARILQEVGVEPGDDPMDAVSSWGANSRFLLPTLRNTFNTTVLSAGMAVNSVPTVAEAKVDGRFVPGYEKEFFEEVHAAVGDDVAVEIIANRPSVTTDFSGAVPDMITSSLLAHDPAAVVIPVCLPIATDAKHFARIGIRNYGFVPLVLPPGYDFPSMFHGIDERIPLSTLRTGVDILADFFGRC